MTVKNQKIIKITALGLSSAFLLSGCGIVEMTDSQTKLIANYAADVLVRYDAGYYDRFKKEETIVKDNTEEAVAEVATEEPVSTEEPVVEESMEPEITFNPEMGDSQIEQATVATDGVSPAELGKLFGLDGVEIAYVGCEELPEYPKTEADQLAFQFKASKEHKLLVFSFEILNAASEARNCNIIGQNIKFRIIVNDSDNLSVERTLLLDDLSQLNVILQSMETRKAVVVCQVPNDYSVDISSLSLVVRTGGEDYQVKLK